MYPSGFQIGLMVVGGIAALYVLYAYNDLSQRWQRLVRLWADVRAVRNRCRGVAHSVAFHLRKATGHEQAVTRHAARRGRSARWISDLSNGWPRAGALRLAQSGLQTDVQTRKEEQDAVLELNRQAEEYNTLIRCFPRCLVAQAFGFRPWRFGIRHRQQRPPRRWQ